MGRRAYLSRDNHLPHFQRIKAPDRVELEQAEMYLIDMEQPAVSVELLRDITTGKLGVKAAGLPDSPFHTRFANFSFINTSPPLKGTPGNIASAKKGTILSWSVSNLIQEKSPADKISLTGKDKNLSWKTLDTERTGVANFSRLYKIDRKIIRYTREF